MNDIYSSLNFYEYDYFFLHACMCISCEPGTHGGLRRGLYALDLVLWMVVICVVPGNQLRSSARTISA